MLDVRADSSGLGSLHVMFGEDILHALDTKLDLILIVRRTVLPEQELKHVTRYGRVPTNLLDQILSNHVTRECIVEFAI